MLVFHRHHGNCVTPRIFALDRCVLISPRNLAKWHNLFSDYWPCRFQTRSPVLESSQASSLIFRGSGVLVVIVLVLAAIAGSPPSTQSHFTSASDSLMDSIRQSGPHCSLDLIGLPRAYLASLGLALHMLLRDGPQTLSVSVLFFGAWDWRVRKCVLLWPRSGLMLLRHTVTASGSAVRWDWRFEGSFQHDSRGTFCVH